MKIVEKIKKISWGYLFISALALALSVLFFAFGHDVLNYLAISIGVVSLLAAILLAVLTMADKKRGFAFGVKIAASVAILTAAIVTLIARESAMSVIISVLALLMIIDGSFKLNSAVITKRQRSAAFTVFLILSVLIIAAGYYSVSFPQADASVYLIAAALLLDAVANFLTLFYSRRIGCTGNGDSKKACEKAKNEK